jgi:FK506-binding protein 2
MRVTLFLFAICVAALASVVAADSKKKLQIGVKKRVEDCKIRSRKGDFLHMHYTVLNLNFYLEAQV